jgi:hypothetical protein
MRNKVFWVATLCVLALASTNAGAVQGKKSDKLPKRIAVRTLASSQMPVTVNKASAELVGKQTVLTYSISNKTSGHMETIEVAVFIVDQSGHIVGGEGWEQSVDLQENLTERFPRILASKLTPGDQLVLAVSKAVGQAGEFKLEAPNLVDAVKSQILGAKTTAHPLQYLKVSFQATETYCQGAQHQADSACKCGIQSFSGNETQKTSSYTCFPRTNCVQQ